MFDTIYLVADNRDSTNPDKVLGNLNHWPGVAAWWKDRLQFARSYIERTTVLVFVGSDQHGDYPGGMEPT